MYKLNGKHFIRFGFVFLFVLVSMAASSTHSAAVWFNSLEIELAQADVTMVGEDDADWAGYFASPAGDVNGDGLGDILVGAAMAGDKVCPYPLNPDGSCPGLPKGQGVAYLILGRDDGMPSTIDLEFADASFLGCEVNSMTARQLYTAGDVNGDGFDDIIISGWKCGEEYTGKAYLFLGREDVSFWGRYYPVEQADASFLGENEWDFLSYYVSTAGDVNSDGYDDLLISSTHHEYDEACTPTTPADCKTCCKNFLSDSEIFEVITPTLPITSTYVTWTVTDTLTIPRQDHTSVLLPNGKVLVAGGFNDSEFLNSAELFDPDTGLWTETGSLNTERAGHTMTLLSNGNVLVTGGYNITGTLSSVEVYNPGSGLWTAGNDLAAPRNGHAATTLENGKVLITGGANDTGYPTIVEAYEPTTGLWETLTTTLNVTRTMHTATLVSTNMGMVVVVVGGENSNGYLDSVEILNPETGLWEEKSGLKLGRSGHTATVMDDGRLIVIGGQTNKGVTDTAEILSPDTGTWYNTGDMFVSRWEHTATLLDNGQIVVTGGRNSGGARASIEVFDPILETWVIDRSQEMHVARSNHTATKMPDGRLIITGGRSCVDYGKVYLILGREAADWGTDFPLSQADASFLGEAAGDRLGRSQTGVGDVNDDGYEDFLIGAKSSDSGGDDAGENYLFLGRATEADPGYDPARPWWGNDFSVANADASFVGEAPGDESGRRVAWTGDVNGDGIDDMIMQSALNDYSGVNAGIAYLVLGRAAGDWGMRFSLANADASFVGEDIHDQAGRRVSGVGDVNNDGYNDLLIGAPHNNRNSLYEKIPAGTAYLIYGRPEVDWGHYYPLEKSDVIYVGKPEIGVAGYDVAWLNDINGDGIDDFLIAAYGGRNNEHTPGEVYAVFGSEDPVAVQFMSNTNQIQVDTSVRFTGEYWEPNGMEDIALTELVLENENYTLKMQYDHVTNELYLWDEDTLSWVGPCLLGGDDGLENGLVRMSCKQSSVIFGLSHNLRVTWQLRWLEDLSNEVFHVHLRVVDLSDHDSGYVYFGEWPVITSVYLPTVLR